MRLPAYILAAVEWHDLGALPWVVVGACGLLAVVLWLYPSQVRTVSGPTRWLLPGLRAAALIVLVLAFLKPTVLAPRPTEDAGAIAVLLDTSRSMGIADTGRGPAQLVMLADGLGLLPEGVRAESARALPAVIERVRALGEALTRADGELEYARLSGRDVAEARSRVEQQQQALRHAVEEAMEVAGQPAQRGPVPARLRSIAEHVSAARKERWLTELRARLEQAERALREFQSSEDLKLYQSDPQVRAACDALAASTRLELAERALLDQAHGLLRRLPRELLVFGYTVGDDLAPLPLSREGLIVEDLELRAADHSSQIAAAIPRVHERLRARDLQAIVLLSDGREVGAGAGGQFVSGLGAADVPVFSILAAPPRSTRDVVVSQIDLPASVYVGEQLVVRAEVRAAGIRNTSTTVTLTAGGEQRTQELRLKDDEPARVEFSLPMPKAGITDVTVTARPLDDEASTDNNALTRPVKVLDDKLAVGLYAGSPSWEYQYLRSTLEKAKGVQLNDRILDPGAALPLAPQELLELDVLILSEVAAGAMSREQKDAVHRLVTERGGSMILLAGGTLQLNAYAGEALLASLLPWQAGSEAAWRIWPGETAGFRAAPADSAAGNDVLRLDQAGDIAQHWLRLPPMYRVLAMPALKPAVRPLLVERASKLPLLTESRLGAGRVFTWAAGESWRWRWKVGEKHHERFWMQLVRHAGEAPYAVMSDELALDVDALRVEPGRELRVRAKRLDGGSGELRVQVMREGQAVEEMALAATGPTGRFERVLSLREPGTYALKLADPSQPGAALSLPLEVVEEIEAELLDLSPDESLMRRLAESSGGQLLTLESVRELPAMLAELAEQRSQTVQWSLWDSPYLFAFVLSCLGLEWALRKRAGLA